MVRPRIRCVRDGWFIVDCHGVQVLKRSWAEALDFAVSVAERAIALEIWLHEAQRERAGSLTVH